ncbi:sodium/proton antiporter NhaB [Microbulbifer hydrolyticus]|uniref:Na(+)/H(+) antiporter NhaB n=1 Tax=Microbulbifer hydrolyticus TaxID=48074 RepID=A0A6P1TCB0_9GAMM|nr:sodium/proton antiporter NhaB [Microbulbifer hydrolyticus]MBB5210672.1 NhaB family Na+:H+ antiporter [Microbulbifer hydrolyticus]QHQ38869.1 sodium/proton antiporter NhaB [Microbulbifer hydrolyticus]
MNALNDIMPSASAGIGRAFTANFLGEAPEWYKLTIAVFLIINPILLYTTSPFITGWVLIGEFIFTLAMALKCYPLQPGGLLAIEAVLLGMTSSESVFHEVNENIQVILLLMFMVAGIYFMKNLLLHVFTKLLINVRSKTALSLLFCGVSAILSAFLDALTVTAVLIAVAVGFYAVYHKVASNRQAHPEHDHSKDDEVVEYHRSDLDQFRSFLRSLIMHGAVGTALGGVCTLVGEPQNLLIAEKAGWNFVQFFINMTPVTMPALAAGLITCVLLEKTGICGYGAKLPDAVRGVLANFAAEQERKRTSRDTIELWVQGVVAIILVLSLAFHVAEVGIIGLMVIVLLTAFNGVIQEARIGHAFEEALPFTALLVVFFAIVAVIHEQHLFEPVTHFVLSLEPEQQPGMLFLANGILSMISDNVFVATVYINEVKSALAAGEITREHFDKLAIAINTGTNLPSVATPNGQAAFLFLLTSALAPLIRLSYGRMVIMALPYTIVLTVVALTCVIYAL